MKYFFFVALAFLLWASSNARNAQTTSSDRAADSLMPFKVFVWHGDEAIGLDSVTVYVRSGKYFANTSGSFFVGQQNEGIWATELDKSKIQACSRFVEIAKSLPKECPNISEGVEEYVICFANDTVRVKNQCDWKGLDFFELRHVLFEYQFVELKRKQEALIKSLNEKIKGKWYFNPSKTEPKRNDILTFRRRFEDHLPCSWDFGESNSFKSSCKNLLNIIYSKSYEWDVDEGEIFFQIEAGEAHSAAERNNIIGSYCRGATFAVDILDENQLKLRFLW